LIELALGRFPFSESASDDDSDLSEFEGTLSPSRPVPLDKKKVVSKEKKRNRRKSKGVSLQGGGMTMSILELLQHIVNEPAPKLTPEGRFSKVAEDFVNSCLWKDPDQRRTPKDLLVRGSIECPTLALINFFFLQHHEWITNAKTTSFDLEVWASTF
jgi:mitogen-activated protein kinase kinase